MYLRKKIAVALVALMPLSLAACSDEDDDGAVTDEEIGELREGAEEAGEQIQEEIEEGAEEAND